jgi:N-acetylmuramoyl-L-alanine amidase
MLKVKDVIEKGDTGLVRGLSLQIIAVMNSISPNVLVDFISTLTHSIFGKLPHKW